MKITEEMMQNNGKVPETQKPAPAPKLSEREKLKRMTGKEKIWYIFTYYKFHFIAAFVSLAILYVIGSTVYNMTFNTALHCLYLNNQDFTDTELVPFEKTFHEWAGLGKKDRLIAENAFVRFEDMSEFQLGNLAKISALVTANELDVMVCDTTSLEYYAVDDCFLDLNELLPEDLKQAASGRFYEVTGADGKKHAIAIDMSGLRFTEESGLRQQPPYYCIVRNSRRVDTAVSLIRFLFEYK